MPRLASEAAAEWIAHALDRQLAERRVDRVRPVPNTAMIGRAREASTRCATRATIGAPVPGLDPGISASSLFGPPIRRDCPAASTRAPIRGPRGFASGFGSSVEVAPARGSGRDGISASRPPLPMRMISPGPTGSPATSRSSTQSKPLTLGERAQPGRPSTTCSPTWPRSSRLPGSTGIPKWSIRPPAATIAAGITSRRSRIAEAPWIRGSRSRDRAPRIAARARRSHDRSVLRGRAGSRAPAASAR